MYFFLYIKIKKRLCLQLCTWFRGWTSFLIKSLGFGKYLQFLIQQVYNIQSCIKVIKNKYVSEAQVLLCMPDCIHTRKVKKQVMKNIFYTKFMVIMYQCQFYKSYYFFNFNENVEQSTMRMYSSRTLYTEKEKQSYTEKEKQS